MASKREQILVYIKSSLVAALSAAGIESAPGAPVLVRRSRTTPISKNEMLAVSLYATSESVEQRVNFISARTLTIQINVFTRGDEPDALADAAVATLVHTLMSDTRLGGLSTRLAETGTSWDFDAEISDDFGVASVTFEIDYTTSADSVLA